MKIRKITTTKTILWLIDIVIFFTCISCNSNNKSNFKYENNFLNYLLDTFKIESISNGIYYIFPMSSCSFCTKESLNVLKNTNSKNTILTLVGEVNSKEEVEFLKLPIPKLYDITQNAYAYGFGLSKPLIIHVNKNKVVNFIEINDNNVEIAKNYLLIN